MFDMHSALNEPTRVSLNTATSIDNILTNFESINYSTKVYKTCISDHFATSITLNLTPPNCEKNLELVRQFSPTNHYHFKNFLANENWTKVIAIENLDESYAIFHNTLTYFFNNCFPISKKYKRNKKKIYQNEKTQQLKNEILQWQNIYYNNRTEENRNSLTKKIKDYKQLLVETKRSKNSIMVNNTNNKQKMYWNLINNERKQPLLKNNITLKEDGEIISNNNEIVNIFNHSYVNIPKQIQQKT